MIVRPYYLNILKTYRDVPLVKILAGIRRCGKSTILDMLKDDLLGSGIAADHVGAEAPFVIGSAAAMLGAVIALFLKETAPALVDISQAKAAGIKPQLG